MKNEHLWRPSKFTFDETGQLQIPARPGELSGASVLGAGLVAYWYRQQLQQHARGRLLDLGAGKVPLYGLYRPHVDEVLCTDWQQSLHGTEHIDFATDLEGRVPLDDACVDTVVLSDVLEHLYQPLHALAEIHRVLRPGGKLVLNVPFMYWVHEAPHDYHRYTVFALQRMARDVGFQVESIDPIGGELCVLADVLGKLLMKMGPPGHGFAEGLQRTMLGHCRNLPRSDTMPLFIGAVLRR